ncbi:translation initiation factor IF-2-like [Ochotona curzoniae]|uniref:translation initiation factor IF-2-like n=1 Tax=Ochotona curzoniae TaxID=130825 RepID=UPI001B34813E|nr:translation initiation factor IF-2-like [Ochotona curzoniae]
MEGLPGLHPIPGRRGLPYPGAGPHRPTSSQAPASRRLHPERLESPSRSLHLVLPPAMPRAAEPGRAAPHAGSRRSGPRPGRRTPPPRPQEPTPGSELAAAARLSPRRLAGQRASGRAESAPHQSGEREGRRTPPLSQPEARSPPWCRAGQAPAASGRECDGSPRGWAAGTTTPGVQRAGGASGRRGRRAYVAHAGTRLPAVHRLGESRGPVALARSAKASCW